MTPQPVATVPTEIAPLPAVNLPAPPSFDFSQLVVGNNDSASPQPPVGVAAPAPSPDTFPVHPFHAKHRSDGSDGAAAAALPVPPVVAQVLPNKSAALPTGATSAVSATGAAGQASAVAAPQPVAAPNNDALNSNAAGPNAAQQNNQSAPQPPGAAELEARIAVGAPTYLSQPNPALAGLLHHQDVGQTGAQGAGAEAGGTPSASASEEAPVSEAAAKFTAEQQPQALAGSHDAASDASLAQQNDASATALPATTDAAAAASTTAAATALPATDGSATQTATTAQTNGAQPAAAAQALPAYEQVAVNLRQAAQAGADRIEIQLKPASLGAIHVKLDVTHDGHITAVISADRSDTLNMLRQDSAGLTQALRDAGLQADTGSLSFNLRGDAQSFAQNQQSQAGGSAPAGSGSSGQSATDTSQPRYRRHDGAVDIEV